MSAFDIEVQRDCSAAAPDAAQLRAWAQLAVTEVRGEAPEQTIGELVIRLVDPAESQSLNAGYRGKDKPTNVLSFPAAKLPFELPELPQPLGDLVICAEVVNTEAAEQGKTPQAHWAHMVIHGCLHLLGYDHLSDEDADVMEAAERRLLATLNFPDPYATHTIQDDV